MKQVVITSNGGPEVLQVVERAELEAGNKEVRIAVKAAGINFADILARRGLYPDAPKLPCTVGYEVCGVVDQVGSAADNSLLGKDVIALTQFNGHSSQVVVPEHQVFLKPESLTYEQGAALPVNYLTAYQSIVAMGGLQPYESVLIHNVGGGVGLAALDLARHIGAHTYGTASSTKHEFLSSRGLDHGIDYRKQDWGSVLNQLTNGRGVDLITDPIGGSHWRKSYQHLASTGRLAMFGISTVAEPGISGKLNLVKMALQTPFYHPFSLMNNNKGVFGVNMGHLWHEHQKIRIWMNAILEGYSQGWVRPYVDKSFSFENAGDAHVYIEERRNIGKVVLTP
ncbi:MAG: alcohol dehydrogenase [Gammaproteobacteria bacterium]|nr:MAG: alcohol dehydrogenase [Gammaproteobacteria bacterium]